MESRYNTAAREEMMMVVVGGIILLNFNLIDASDV